MKKFSLVLANFPFSDEFWWLKPEQQTDDKKKKEKLKKEIFGKEGYKDPYGRFGRGTAFKARLPAMATTLSSSTLCVAHREGRAGVVCPQGVLFRGQPEIEEETGEFDEDGNPIDQAPQGRRRASDSQGAAGIAADRCGDFAAAQRVLRRGRARLPAHPAKQRPPERHDKVLLVYAARHYRELSNQNELRPQDVMRMLVHSTHMAIRQGAGLVAQHSGRIREQINPREHEEVERLEAEYADTLRGWRNWKRNAEKRAELKKITVKTGKEKAEAALAKLEGQRDKAVAKIAERDEKIAEARRRAEEDRRDVEQVWHELGALYGDADELLKHARVVGMDEIEENEFNLNIPRYVDTFEPEPTGGGEGCAEGARRRGESR